MVDGNVSVSDSKGMELYIKFHRMVIFFLKGLYGLTSVLAIALIAVTTFIEFESLVFKFYFMTVGALLILGLILIGLLVFSADNIWREIVSDD